MFGLNKNETLFVICAFLFQIVLIVHFALRKWSFETVARYGWIVYALAVPAAVVSVILLMRGAHWWFWLGGFLFLIWAAFGLTVEFLLGITDWRGPVINWAIFVPYVLLYLATVMFYWWPLARIRWALWVVGAALFVVSTVLNVISHGKPQ